MDVQCGEPEEEEVTVWAQVKPQCTNQAVCRRLLWSQFAGACLSAVYSQSSTVHYYHYYVPGVPYYR